MECVRRLLDGTLAGVAIEVEKDHRRDEERDHLGEGEAADDRGRPGLRQTQTLKRFLAVVHYLETIEQH